MEKKTIYHYAKQEKRVVDDNKKVISTYPIIHRFESKEAKSRWIKTNILEAGLKVTEIRMDITAKEARALMTKPETEISWETHDTTVPPIATPEIQVETKEEESYQNNDTPPSNQEQTTKETVSIPEVDQGDIKTYSIEEVRRRVQKLLTLADPSRGASEGEMSAAMEKVHELLSIYNMTLLEATVTDEGTDYRLNESVTAVWYSLGVPKDDSYAWCRILGNAIGHLTYTKAMFAGPTKQGVFIGTQLDCDVAVTLYGWVVQQMKSLLKVSRREAGLKSDAPGAYKWGTDWLTGCANRVSVRIHESATEAHGENQLVRATDKANQAFALEAYGTKKEGEEPQIRDIHSSYKVTTGGYRTGYLNGDKVAITTNQISSDSNTPVLMVS